MNIPLPIQAKILLVDDSETDLENLEAILAELGEQLVRAKSGQEALTALYHGEYALAILDIRMTDMDGFEAARVIRSQRRLKSLPIMFITALDPDKEDLERAYALGAVDFISKPLIPTAVRSKARVFVDLFKREKEARQSQSRFESISELSPDGQFFTDARGNCLWVNEKWSEIAGLSHGEALGEGWSKAIHPEDRDRVFADWYRSAREGRVFRSEYRFLRADGAATWVLGQAKAELDLSGNISGYIGTITDITDRKAVETSLARAVEATTGELRGKTEELDAVLDSVPAAIWITKDPEGKVIVGNKRSYDLVGMSPGENVSKSSPDGETATPYEIYIDGRRARPEELPIQRCAATGQPIYGQEQEIRGPGNRSRWIYGNAIPLLDERGKVKQVISAFIDVTERKRAERDRALLAALVESSEDAITAIDLAGAITSWNRGAVALYGYSEKEALGQPDSIIIPEDLRADQVSVLERVRRGERIEHYETRRRTREGRLLDVSLAVSPIRDGAGEIVGFSKIARDISERKRAQERTRFLAHAAEMLSASLDYERTISKVADFAARSPLSDWCAVVLKEGDSVRQAAVAHRDPVKVRWAREFERRYPFDPGRDRMVMDVIETGRPLLLAEIPDALLRAGARDEDHYRALKDAGMRSAMVVPLAAAGRVLGALTLVSAESRRTYTPEDLELAESLAERAAIAFENARLYRAAQEDIARRKEVEEQIRAVNATLEARIQERTAKLTEALHELEAFSYTVAHDLRAPLRAMAGLSRILMEEHIQKADETGHEYARRIVESGKRMDAMVQDLLEYSRLVREDLQLEPVDLGELLREVLSSMDADLAERGASVTVRDPFPAVLAHRGALAQAITNLIQNAAKFVLPGKRPEIIISAETKAGPVVLSVEDHGIGIAPEHHDRIFGVFQRLHDERAYPGTGIGLAIVRKAMERMGGRAGVESQPGRGSRFWLELKQGG